MNDLNALNLEEGSQVGGYHLISRLGSGAMGSVWRVRDEGGQVYAMKILRDSLSEDQTEQSARGGNRDRIGTRERLRREAMALRKIRHPGVCQIVDMEIDDALAFIVTELIEGKNLREDVEDNGRYVGDDLERLAGKLMDAVAAVHSVGIIHRDIKPTNVMVSSTGPVLVDFGIAMGEGESHMTRTGLVMGTPGFIAPEIIEGYESNQATDWWSVASVLAFAATGKPVFGSKPMMAVLEREASGNADLASLPGITLTAFRSAMDPDPSKRSSPQALLHAIRDDAMDPSAWLEEGNADSDDATAPSKGTGGEEHDGQGVVPPFLRSPTSTIAMQSGEHHKHSPDDDGSLRVLWRQEPAEDRTREICDRHEISEGTTSTLPAPSQPVSSQPAPPPADTVIGATLPWYSSESFSPTSTRILKNKGGDCVDDRHASPSNTVPIGQNHPEKLVHSSQPPAYLPEPTSLYAGGSIGSGMPTEMPVSNPSDIRRDLLVRQSTPPLILLGLPLGIIGAMSPLTGLVSFSLAVWLLSALGLNKEAQLEREWRRGGQRRLHDGPIRLVSFPWHLFKALLQTLPRIVLATALWLIGISTFLFVVKPPSSQMVIHVGTFQFSCAVPTVGTLSLTGFAGLLVTALCWYLTVFAIHSFTIRLGMGTLLGPSVKAQLHASGTLQSPEKVNGHHYGRGRRPALLVIWSICTMLAIVAMSFNQPINCPPLSTILSSGM